MPPNFRSNASLPKHFYAPKFFPAKNFRKIFHRQKNPLHRILQRIIFLHCLNERIRIYRVTVIRRQEFPAFYEIFAFDEISFAQHLEREHSAVGKSFHHDEENNFAFEPSHGCNQIFNGRFVFDWNDYFVVRTPKIFLISST